MWCRNKLLFGNKSKVFLENDLGKTLVVIFLVKTKSAHFFQSSSSKEKISFTDKSNILEIFKAKTVEGT